MGFLCDYCGYTEDTEGHEDDQRHRLNKILFQYKKKKSGLSGNRNGAYVSCDVTLNENPKLYKDNVVNKKITVNVKPKSKLKFTFKIQNEMKKSNLLLLGLHLGHPQEQYKMDPHPYSFDSSPHDLKKNEPVFVTVRFKPEDVGQFNMPIMFTFQKKIEETDKNKKKTKEIIIVREIIVIAEESPKEHQKVQSVYKKKEWTATDYVRGTGEAKQYKFPIPKHLIGWLNERIDRNLERTEDPVLSDINRTILKEIKEIMDDARIKTNYMEYYHHLLWLDEAAAKINLKKYNMSEVVLTKKGHLYILEVPGLAEKRPSLLRGDKVIISRYWKEEEKDSKKAAFQIVEFEGSIKKIEESVIHIGYIDMRFAEYYSPEAMFNVRFILSRFPRECMHLAVSRAASPEVLPRLFPLPVSCPVRVPSIAKFYNKNINGNEEQKAAVEHLVAKSSGLAPYMVYGPPGTGKTVTIVEAILQIVVHDPKALVWVCTDSNMAADHVALQILRHQDQLSISKLLFRASSRDRVWNILPPELVPVSNGNTYDSSYSVTNTALAQYRIVVTTLLHAAKYSSSNPKIKVSHLFIDEAAQALETACLVPIVGLLEAHGQLVLAGDPRQLGPVLTSQKAKGMGLGTSLMEELYNNFTSLYGDDRKQKYRYITMLVNNFRSDPDILEIPNEYFYDGKLKPLAPLDPLSRTSILDLEGGKRAIVFHGVNSKEEKLGKSPSFFNQKEFEMVKRYITALINKHKVQPQDIGVISPYLRQVALIKEWLISKSYKNLEVGTVEAFQGKEKRVILVSTVRANCDLLGYDKKFDLGFLVDRKRFNVAVTRAKAKLIIIGNKSCLERDVMWDCFMKRCLQHKTYYGQDTEQMERTMDLLHEIAVDRFNKCHISDALREVEAHAQ